MITSKFRLDFWFGKVSLLLGASALSGFLLYLSYKDGHFDFRHVWFWTSILVFIWVSIRAYAFLFDEVKIITVSEKCISIRHLMWDSEKILYPEIKKMELFPVYATRGKSRSSFVSHYELIITLGDGDTLCFDGYQYENFNAVKSMIYHYAYHHEKQPTVSIQN